VEAQANERLHLVANPGLAGFRAVLTPATDRRKALILPEATLAVLGARPGDILTVS
jgi:arginine N-succinyltransferase